MATSFRPLKGYHESDQSPEQVLRLMARIPRIGVSGKMRPCGRHQLGTLDVAPTRSTLSRSCRHSTVSLRKLAAACQTNHKEIVRKPTTDTLSRNCQKTVCPPTKEPPIVRDNRGRKKRISSPLLDHPGRLVSGVQTTESFRFAAGVVQPQNLCVSKS